MSSALVELTATIVSAHAAKAEMSSDDLLQEIQNVFTTLKKLNDDGSVAEEQKKEEPTATNPKKSILKDQIICLECNQGGFKTLARHLKNVHNMDPKEYRKKHGFPSKTPLAAKSYSEARRKTALDNKLGEKLVKSRQQKLAKKAAENSGSAN